MSTDIMSQGLELMLVGMGTVFVFLTLLVLATVAMSRLVLRFEGAPGPAAPAVAGDDDEIAAIAAAIARHRRRSR